MAFPAKILWLMLWTVCAAQDCKESPPRQPTEILTGSWSAETYPQGTKATYKCRPGYRTYGMITRECRGGQWVAHNPSKRCQKKPCGHPGDMPFGSFELAEGDKFEYGAKVIYTCNPGYHMIGEVNFRECEADGWTNDIPLCEVVKCLPVTEPVNGRIVSSAYELDQEYDFGQVIKFECNAGFMLDGPKEIHCSNNGLWSEERPNCVEISCKIPNIPHGEPTTPKNSYKEKERLQFRCFPGYGYVERAEAVCTQSGWNPPPACQEVTCDPPRFANGYYTPNVAKYRLGEMITYHCTNGFYPSTRGNTAKCTEVDWQPPPRCSFKPCDYPEIEHGELYKAERYRPYFPARVGQYYRYSCHQDYVTDSYSSGGYLTCTPKGWSPEVPCHRKCVFNYLQNGHYPYHQRSYLQGQSVKVDCHPGYSLPNQHSTMTCMENGWFPPPKCIRVETCLKSDVEIENGFLAESEDTYPLHRETQYRCKQGYVTEDGQTSGSITCRRGGWSARPKCIKSCGTPVFENARAKAGGTWFKVNDRLEYECKDGYKNEAGHTTGVIECGDNGWSGAPTCRVKECIIPDIEENLVVQHPLDKYRVGDVLKFTCRRNRDKIVGPDSIQCYDFGWSPNLPTCKAAVKPCGPQPQLPNGKATNTPKEEYEHGDVAEYACNPRFLLKGSKRVQCVDGEWTTLPRCIEEDSTCEYIPEIDHGYATARGPPYYHGESVEFNCIEGYTVIGHSSMTCIKGSWTELPQCIETNRLNRCKLSRETIEKTKLPNKYEYDHNVVIRYSCGGKSEQKKHSICTNGRWNPEVTCEEVSKCPPPPQIPKSENMATTLNYLEGERIPILCQESALIQGAEEIECHNGTWQSIPRCVEKMPCSQPPHIEHGTINSPRASEETFEPQQYAHGTKLNYICEDGFRLSEAEEITCHLGRWSSPPQCVGLPCDSPPPSIDNGQVTTGPRSYPHGAEVKYRCAIGFGIHGPASVKCLGGKWSHPPECIKAFCSDPPSFDNAKLQQSKKKSYASGEQVTYTCPQYFQMDGSNSVQCTNGKWIGNIICRDMSCGSPPTVENAIVRNQKPRYVSDETVYYECTNSLDLYGNAEVTCFNGNWSKPPECRESRGKCGPPPPINNGDITTFPLMAYAPGSSVEYQCQAYYELQGSRKVTCRDGKWSELPRCLDACVISEEMMRKHNIELRWKYAKKIYTRTEDEIEFQCLRGYRPESQRTAFRVPCQEGKVAYPTCVRRY